MKTYRRFASLLPTLLIAAAVAAFAPATDTVSAAFGRWEFVDRNALDVAVAPSGTRVALNGPLRPGGRGVTKWSTSGCPQGSVGGCFVEQQPPIGARRIAIDGFGNIWVVQDSGAIFQLINTFPGPGPVPPPYWRQRPGSARDIAGDPKGGVWIVGTSPRPGGFGILRWNDNNGNWVEVGGGATRITVAPDGAPWVVSSPETGGAVYRYTSQSWLQWSGSAHDIAVSSGSVVWLLGMAPVPGGYPALALPAAFHAPVSLGGSGTDITVGPDGLPWVINSAGEIWRFIL